MDESSPPHDGEFRLVTIMFADVVGSTALGERLGAETSRIIMDRCLRRLNQEIATFGGTVARLMGDGLLAFFGAPRAHEDDPVRAVLAALRMQESIRMYAQELGQPLQVRIGINTGRAVMGDMGDEIFSEYTGMGMPVNLAARLESVATPGSTLVGETTARLIRHKFELHPAGPFSLKGFPEPVIAFELKAESAPKLPARRLSDLHSPLVGRHRERQDLTGLLKGLQAGRGAICTLIAGPGIGKSRLLREAGEDVADQSVQWASGRAYSYSQEQAFGVIIDLLADLLGLAADDTPALVDLKLERVLGPLLGESLGQVWPFVAALLGAPVPPQYESQVAKLTPSELNSKISIAIQQSIEALAAKRPLVLAFDDLHWGDQSSILLIESLMLSTERSPILLILVFRPERTKPAWNLKVHAETQFAHRYVELMLAPLDDAASQLLVENLLQTGSLPRGLRQLIQQAAEGNPFFVEELIADLIERRLLARSQQRWEFVGDSETLQVPDTVESVIQARLDRLSPEARATLQAASVIGRRFQYSLLDAIAAQNADLPQQLLQLQRADLIREWSRFPEQEYIFKHVLVQETTYQTLLADKKTVLHRLVGDALEKLFPDRLDEYAARLAFHFEAAGSTVKATHYLLEAGKRAARLGSSQEAAGHLQRGLELLRTLPDSPDKDRKELALLTVYGASQVGILGPNAEKINTLFGQVHQLSKKLGVPTSKPMLRYLALSNVARTEYARTFEYGQQLLNLADQDQDSVARVEGLYVLGIASYWQGDLMRAKESLSRAINAYDPDKQDEHLALYSQDPLAVCLSRLAIVQWALGYPDQAVETSQEAGTLARTLGHPNTLGYVLTWISWLYHLNRDSKAALAHFDEAIAFCEKEQLIFWLPQNLIFRGWALVGLNDTETGLSLLEQGLAGYEGSTAAHSLPYFRALSAASMAKSGDLEENISKMLRYCDVIEESGERWCLPEMHRLIGELLLTGNADPARCEQRYLRAIELAQGQKARGIELRATTELCQLWQKLGKRQEAHRLLTKVYNTYTEGFEQEDLKKARRVLDNLDRLGNSGI